MTLYYDTDDREWIRNIETFRKREREWRANREKTYKLDKTLQRDLQPGWLLPYLAQADLETWGRWQYWTEAMYEWALPDRQIPKIRWGTDGLNQSSFDQAGHKHLEKCLDLIPGHGGWQGWSSWQYVDYFFDWLLFGFAHPGYEQLPEEPSGCEGASMRLYQTFNLNLLVAYPHDYWGDILALNSFGKRLGFYPTPMPVCIMMAEMMMHDTDKAREDTRVAKVCDPCLGTGRMLLAASNYSLCLYGQDINETVIKASLINGYLYAPWMVKPFPFLKEPIDENSEAVSNSLAEAAAGNAAAVEYLADTEHDAENQYKFEPIKKRRKKASANQEQEEAMQGLLF